MIIKLHLKYSALNLNIPFDKFKIATLMYRIHASKIVFILILANFYMPKLNFLNIWLLRNVQRVGIFRFISLYLFSRNYLPLISLSSTIGCSIFCLYKSLFCLKGTIFLTLFGTNWDLQMFKMVNDITKNSINLIVQWCLSD